MYFVIANSDGDTCVESLNKEELLKRLDENYYGIRTVLNDIPENNDTNYWGEGILIIKGSVVVPQGVEKVIKYDIK